MTALDILRQMAIDDHKKKYPLSWDGDRSKTYWKPDYNDKSEKGLKKCIKDFCEFTGNFAESISNKGTPVDNREIVENVIGQLKMIGSVEYFYSQNTNGTADMQAKIKPKNSKYAIGVAVEIKIPGDTWKKHQKDYKKKIEAAGGVYIIVRDFQDFFEWYNSFVENF